MNGFENQGFLPQQTQPEDKQESPARQVDQLGTLMAREILLNPPPGEERAEVEAEELVDTGRKETMQSAVKPAISNGIKIAILIDFEVNRELSS